MGEFRAEHCSALIRNLRLGVSVMAEAPLAPLKLNKIGKNYPYRPFVHFICPSTLSAVRWLF